MSGFIIQTSGAWEEVEPDGGHPCYCCGDAIYLRQWQYILRSGSAVLTKFDPFPLCDACHDGIDE